MKRLTNEEFIERAILKHGNKFNYDKVDLINTKEHVIIKCNSHNIEYGQRPANHLNGNGGCKLCQKEKMSKSNEDYIKEVTLIHKSFYDYSKTKYSGAYKKINIICPIHGEFKQVAKDHYENGCPQCGLIRKNIKNTMTTQQFIEKANLKYDYKYDYSRTNYVNNNEYVEIICPIHGKFNMIACRHLSEQGCPKCGKERQLIKLKENPSGWTCTQWTQHSKTSKYFDSFKVYLIRC